MNPMTAEQIVDEVMIAMRNAVRGITVELSCSFDFWISSFISRLKELESQPVDEGYA